MPSVALYRCPASAVPAGAPVLLASAEEAPLPLTACTGLRGGGINRLFGRFSFVGAYHPPTGTAWAWKVYEPRIVRGRGRPPMPAAGAGDGAPRQPDGGEDRAAELGAGKKRDSEAVPETLQDVSTGSTLQPNDHGTHTSGGAAGTSVLHEQLTHLTTVVQQLVQASVRWSRGK